MQSWQIRQTRPLAVHEIDRLLDDHTDREIAALLNERGYRSGQGKTFSGGIVARIRHSYGLRDRFTRLRSTGLLTLQEYASAVGVCSDTVKRWRRRGLLRAYPYDDKGTCLYDPPGTDVPKKGAWKRPRLDRKPRAHS